MIRTTAVQNSLNILDQLYQGAGLQEAQLYSKMALLELCGWIEESMDDLILSCAVRKAVSGDNLRIVEKDIIKRNNGFDYDKHFRSMLMRVVGIINVQELEQRVDPAKQAQLKTELVTLKTVRDAAAHTHLSGTQQTLDAPSLTVARFGHVHAGLVEYENVLQAMNL